MKKKRNKKVKINSDMILKVVFCILLIVVIVLGVLVLKKNRENKDKVQADIIMPVYDDNSQSTVTINAINMGSEYVIKVINYKKNKINKESYKYDVDVKNNTKSNITVTKNSNKTNLMKDNSNTIITGESLSNKKEENIYYHIKVNDKTKLGNKDTIVVKIRS